MIYKKLYEAFKGRVSWKRLQQKYEKDDACIRYIIFPSNIMECNMWGIILLPLFIKRNRLEKIVIIASNRKILETIKLMHINNIIYLYYSEKKIKRLLSYYSLIDKSKKWTVVSVKEPYDTGAEHLLGKKGITYKEIVYFDIYKLSDLNIDSSLQLLDVDLNEVRNTLESSEVCDSQNVVHER